MKTILNLPMNILRSFFSTINLFLTAISKQIVSFFHAFKRPMATSINSMRGLVISLLVGLFVAIVAVGVQPFGLSDFNHESKTLYLIGFGVVAFIGMLVAKFALPQVLKGFYDDQNWTIGRQVVHLTVVMLIIGLLILTYNNYFSIASFTLIEVLKVVAVGVIPAIVITFIQQKLFHTRFTSAADDINSNLSSLNLPASKQILPVLVFGESGQKLSLLPNQLIYAETSKDSTDFYWQNLMGVEKTTVQTSLDNVEKELSSHPQFVRLHRNFVVNMRGIHKVEGNARGYHLYVARKKHAIPVSWKFHKKLEEIGK
ncbi:LytTR family transcriptional regulator DNA-binding domain-containing protein [Emticicia sp. SJ17W-69]|uniref:LytTR family transcriptional regulator DNA-binding domain-containing protein n=1 Tax=Emticicia sp. SJ17W-69 TaxID=3421657 RepID=UPI003EBA5715